ncbi:MAG: polyprenyl synthetase family protein [Eubacteriales bacterium]|nr:polyprenyl synthetase family protein [Eubacteriales bacterium]
MFNDQYQQYLNRVEAGLELALPDVTRDQVGRVVEAARYSLLGGGKRVRPILLLATLDCLATANKGHQTSINGLNFALAIEMIHTYSLIHDDLPCMDDDDLRRGRLTCHKQFSEAIAVLAGDTLLNHAFETMLSDPLSETIGGVKAMRIIAHASGAKGMIGGQALDLEAEGQQISADQLKQIHSLKTGQLISAPVLAACALAQINAVDTADLRNFAENIGLAFQIQDDILDVTASSAKLGKTIGKDARDEKSTYVSIFGLTMAKTYLIEASDRAVASLIRLKQNGFDTAFLSDLTQFLLKRDF